MATGTIDDLINYAGCVKGCGLVTQQDVVTGDVCKTRADIIPCPTQTVCAGGGTGTYFVNGFDLAKAALAYDSATQTLYLGYRVAGVIGDTDGNGNADNAGGANCSTTPTIIDTPGIGLSDSYLWFIDTNCDGNPDIQVSASGSIANPTIKVVDGNGDPIASVNNVEATITGSDIKIKIPGISDPNTGKPGLPVVFQYSGFVGSTNDGLSEDGFGPLICASPSFGIDIAKTASPVTLCPDASTVVTLSIHNTSTAAVSSVTATDDLPAGIQYVAGSAGGTCSPGEPTINGQNLSWNIGSLDADASCTITFSAKRVGTTCFGTVTNHSSVTASFQSACVNGGAAVAIGPQTSDFDLVCVDAPRVTLDVVCNPDHQCAGGSVSLDWSVKNTSLSPETITIDIDGHSHNLGTVAAGDVRTGSEAATMPSTCPASGSVEFKGSASASNNDCAGGLDAYARDSCDVACIPPAKLTCDLTANPTSACEGDKITLRGTVTNTSGGTEHLTMTIAGTLYDFTDVPDGGSYSRDTVVTMPACTNGDRGVDYSLSSTASNSNCTGTVTCTDKVTIACKCPVEGLCRITGGGCLNEKGPRQSHKDHTFGGNVSPAHDGGGPTGNEWEHVVRDGREITFNFHSHDAHITDCSPVPPGPCSPQANNTRADFEGTGTYSLGAGSRTEDANFTAYIIDHKEGACNKNVSDVYSITVRKGLVQGQGDVVFTVTGDIDCGNLQIHETPASILGGGVSAQQGSDPEAARTGANVDVALLNRAIPNPFSGSMSYSYRISGGGQSVSIGVYDMAGRLVRTLASGFQGNGQYTVRWDSHDEHGAQMPQGVYFVRSRVADTANVTRVVLLRR